MAFFSIVIPIYNGGEHIRECLDSLLHQPFKDIEVICIDDSSSDQSPNILQEYASSDTRVKVITNKENQGSARGRRCGVLASTGNYVLFSDQDDSYAPDTFKKLYIQLIHEPVDVLQYGTRLFNDGNVPQGEIDGINVWLEPYHGRLEGRDILDSCFVDASFGYSIWNKAYEGDMARRAFSATKDVFIPLGEDNYASFVLLYYAKTYRGLPGKKFYRYHYGRGFTGRGSQSADSFRRTCGLAVAADLISCFLVNDGSFEEYQDVCRAARMTMLEYTIDRWLIEVEENDKVTALKAVLDQWPYQEVLDAMARLQPTYLPQLIQARFGKWPFADPITGDPSSAFDELNQMYQQMELVAEKVNSSRHRVEELTRTYEESRAYRIGRAVTAPARMMRRKE